MKRFSPAAASGILIAFLGGFFSHALYQRWNAPLAERQDAANALDPSLDGPAVEPRSFRVTFVPMSAPAQSRLDLPQLQARDVDKIRSLAGNQARIRGRIFRVGHSAKSNTFFLNFGPSREALTAVIFAPAAELFEKNKLMPKSFEGKEIEVQGEIKDHPQYGLEIIVENPSQVRVID